jgi:uncharacterized protein YbcV (DUF1398 family)
LADSPFWQKYHAKQVLPEIDGYCQHVRLIEFTEAGAIVQQGTPMMEGTYEVPKFDQEALVQAIRSDQAGTISFLEFLRFAWEAGIIALQVDFIYEKWLKPSASADRNF